MDKETKAARVQRQSSIRETVFHHLKTTKLTDRVEVYLTDRGTIVIRYKDSGDCYLVKVQQSQWTLVGDL